MIYRALSYCFGLLVLIISVVISPDKVDTKFDQTNALPPQGMLSHNLLHFSPLGQSFTPTMSSLNFVNLLTESGDATVGDATVKVNIRSGSISGPILGTSQPTVIPFSVSPSVSSFRFSAPVTLNPGDVYVIEPFVVCGNTLIGSTDANNYLSGNQILGGVAQTKIDLWFQEGISVPERRKWPLVRTGLIALIAIVFFNSRSILHKLTT
ncbi:MAG TPA: hypothetical protein VNU20_00685 [Candidatus Sulfotelmatobacter sp.]|jgi:hypothetical protein|nr:hypothetical protein [Candidatus Sulfotelmatobacter sp.]